MQRHGARPKGRSDGLYADVPGYPAAVPAEPSPGRPALPWLVALALTTPVALAHPLTFVVFFALGSGEPFMRDAGTNVDELTWTGRLAWIGIALALAAMLGAVAYLAFHLGGRDLRRFAQARSLSQLGYLLLAPLAYLVVTEPIEGNIVGFFYFPYFLLGTAVGLTFSLVTQVLVFVMAGKDGSRESGLTGGRSDAA